MAKTAFIFSGQGAQYVGMGAEIYDYNLAVREVFDFADSLTEGKITRLCFEGPQDELNLTVNTQPCILTVEAALLIVAEDLGLRPDITAGFSLGEYGALICGGVLSFQEALRLVLKRAELMNQAALENKGSMAAILGMNAEEVKDACKDTCGYVEAANLNCPGQTVVAGDQSAVSNLVEILSARGAKCVPLSVNGAFHSKHMENAASEYANYLKDFEFKKSKIPLVSNTTAKPEKKLKGLAVEQMCSPVLWEKSIRYMIQEGVEDFVELGPGNVLTGLMKRIDKRKNSFHISKLIKGVKA